MPADSEERKRNRCGRLRGCGGERGGGRQEEGICFWCQEQGAETARVSEIQVRSEFSARGRDISNEHTLQLFFFSMISKTGIQRGSLG